MPSLRSETASNPTGQTKRSKPRVTIYRNPDGSYDTSSLSDEDKARLFGGAPPPAEPAAAPAPDPSTPAPEPIDPAIIGMALNLLTSIEAAVVGRRLGIPEDRCYAALQPRPPFDQAITSAATKVANKYGASLGPYADEIALVALLATWQITAFAELRSIAAEQTAKTTPPPPNADATKHESPSKPTPPPAAPTPEPVKSNIVPIDLLIGAHAATGGGMAGAV